MEITVGSGRFVTSSPWSDPDYRRTLTTDPSQFGRRPVFVYLWECRLEPGGNPPVPAFLVVECIVSAGRVGPGGTADPADIAARKAQLLADTGCKDDEVLRRRSAAALPPVTFVLDIPRPHPFMTDRNRVHVLAWPSYSDIVISAARPNATGYLLSIPRSIRLELLVTGHCGPADPAFPDPVGRGQRHIRSEALDRPMFDLPVDWLHERREKVVGESSEYWWTAREPDPEAMKTFDKAVEEAEEAQRQALRGRLKGG